MRRTGRRPVWRPGGTRRMHLAAGGMRRAGGMALWWRPLMIVMVILRRGYGRQGKCEHSG